MKLPWTPRARMSFTDYMLAVNLIFRTFMAKKLDGETSARILRLLEEENPRYLRMSRFIPPSYWTQNR